MYFIAHSFVGTLILKPGTFGNPHKAEPSKPACNDSENWRSPERFENIEGCASDLVVQANQPLKGSTAMTLPRANAPDTIRSLALQEGALPPHSIFHCLRTCNFTTCSDGHVQLGDEIGDDLPDEDG
jgi:hypothetical protein